mmetsp:Transcript_60022/g.127131  ORF Transcript_60022/g.127131 Transcript_60022/m.127131 type:complete len:240 (-) Transcript_60022:35-754(-)|eukprot:CAMPEP_0206481300 /NCGR_PEP_ID=MMETSP0324_2-20121206/38055_1 /ASSEMBLY_ACC=CAM_ASM_000836 /TAXON_ID=2866 /ORGANISM="Crypthecodinium cohnii, Strain Seligo" /LENGTH=239 /DNA_ID=CAMNT_0053958747 /DNA_START=24 /DNA_END=743 /DNA_ORIENTATION=+
MFCCCADNGDHANEAVFAKTSAAMTAAEDNGPLLEEVQPQFLKEAAASTGGKKPVVQSINPGDISTFSVTLSKSTPDAPLGWHLDVLDTRLLYICRIAGEGSSTPIDLYNAKAPENKKILQGDYVLEVNGSAGASGRMREAIKASNEVSVKIGRPITFKKSIYKAGEGSLGLDLKYGAGGVSLLVEGIGPGAIQKQAPEVEVGDRIVMANGAHGTPEALMQAIQEATLVELLFSRAPTM